MSKYKPCYHKGETGFMDTDLILNDIRKWLNETNDGQTLIDTLDICLFFGKIENQEQEIQRLKEEYMILQNASDEVEEKKDREIEKLNTIIEIKTNRIQDLMSRLSKRQDRIDKAIEYIEKNSYTTIETIDDINYFIVRLDKCPDLLDILKGSDKE